MPTHAIRPTCIEPLEARIAPAAAAIDLGALNGRDGFVVPSLKDFNQLGYSVSAAGDLNDDGLADVVVAGDGRSSDAAAAYVIFGTTNGFNPIFDLAALDGTNGFALPDTAATDSLGQTVSPAGDVNGDGVDDLLIDSRAGDFSGAAFVLFGRTTPWPASVDVNALTGSDGFLIAGQGSSIRSDAVAGVGDVNGDGFADVLVGRPYANGGVGAAYLIFGRSSGFPATLNVLTLAAGEGVRIDGIERGSFYNEHIGATLAAAGDLNGDGFDDLLLGNSRGVGGPKTAPNHVYVVFGHGGTWPATFPLTALDGSNGFQLAGKVGESGFGRVVAPAGDLDGDGFDDIAISSYQDLPKNRTAFRTYVIYGKSSAFPAEVLPGRDNVRVTVIGGSSLRPGPGGDINGDGFADLLVGGWYRGDDKPGRGYVVFGGEDGLPKKLDVTKLKPREGLVLEGAEARDFTGRAMAFAGDLNGDGFGDVAIGAYATEGYDGAAYVVFGFDARVNVKKARGGASALEVRDSDGDVVTVRTNKGKIVPQDFQFDGNGALMVDLSRDVNGFREATIDFSAKTPKGGNGDGLVRVGMVDATGVKLKKLTVKGPLDNLFVGEGIADQDALDLLEADSLGGLSTIDGTLGTLRIKKDITGVLTVTAGISETIDNLASAAIRRLVVLGNVDGSAGGAEAGLVKVNGGIKEVVIKGDVIGGADRSGIVSNGQFDKVTIKGDLRSSDPTKPVVISALGVQGSALAVAIKKVVIEGNVENAQILAGYRRDGTAKNPDASIGDVFVKGSWVASSVVAGLADSTADGFGRNDTLISGDTTPNLFSRIASVTINGTATGSVAVSDHFGITAQRVGKVIINGQPLTLNPNGPDDSPLGDTGDFRIREI